MKKSPCTHIKGAEYGGKLCCYILDEPFDAYEWSFVAVPAQKKCRSHKDIRSKVRQPDYDALRSELAQTKKMKTARQEKC